MSKGAIRLEAVEKWFGDVQVIKGVDLEVAPGEFVVFVGPSGCGKSTLLRMISGLEETSYGKIWIDDRDATTALPSERGLSMVFQSYALYPHMSVADNIGFGLKTAGAPRAEIKARVAEAAEVLELTDYLARRPKDLSGGQRQRVAIGRAIVRDPAAFLFDEPLSNLDAALRVQMRFEISKLHDRLGASMIYVTHDQVEAMTLADKIVVLRGGEIMQVGNPRELYERPDNLFVAQFIGSPRMNVLSCKTDDGRVRVNDGPTIVTLSSTTDQPDRLGIRPEHISFAEEGTGHLVGRIDYVEYLGADTYYYVEIGDHERLLVRDIGDAERPVGTSVELLFQPDRVHLFSEHGSRLDL